MAVFRRGYIGSGQSVLDRLDDQVTGQILENKPSLPRRIFERFGAIILGRYAEADLPTPHNAGALAWVTDGARGLWGNTGSQWFSTSGEVVNVKEFGAVGDGTTDDTAAIQAAVDAAAGAGGDRRIVFFPAATYAVNGTINCDSKPVTLMGHGSRGTFLKGNGTNVIVRHAPSTDTTGMRLVGLGFFHSPTSSTIDAVQIGGGAGPASLWEVRDCTFTSSRYGLFLDNDARLGYVGDCIFGSNNQVGLRMDPGANLNRIVGCWFDENLVQGISTNAAKYNSIVGCHFQDNVSRHIQFDGDSDENTITGCTFQPGAGTNEVWRLFNGDRNVFIGNTIVAGHNTACVTFTAGQCFDNVFAWNVMPDTHTITGTRGDNTVIRIADNGGVSLGAMNALDTAGTGWYSQEMGSASAPAFSFDSDDDTGMYRSTANELSFAAGGSRRFALSSTGMGFYGTAPAAKPTITGERDANPALADLLTDLASLGLITDNTTEGTGGGGGGAADEPLVSSWLGL